MAPKSYHGRGRVISEAIRRLGETEPKHLRRKRHSDLAASLQELKLVPTAPQGFLTTSGRFRSTIAPPTLCFDHYQLRDIDVSRR
jgi:hypothetical protein